MTQELIGSGARALASLFHPRMLWLSVMPFLLAGAVWGGVMYFCWEAMVSATRTWLEAWQVVDWLYKTLDALQIGQLRTVVAPLFVMVFLVPLIVVSALLLIAVIATPAAIAHLARRTYPDIVALHGGSVWSSLGNSLWATLLFLVFIILSLPFWLIPPLFLVIPPLLWGWLTYRVLGYDALVDHASREERRQLLEEHRLPLLIIGIITGMLGAAPAFFWVTSALALVLFPVIALVSLWIYVLIFIFSSLWFGHYCLRALQRQRATRVAADAANMAPASLSAVEAPSLADSASALPASPPDESGGQPTRPAS